MHTHTQVRCVPVEADIDFKDVRSNDWWGDATVRSKLYDTTLDSVLVDSVAQRPADSERNAALQPQKLESTLTLAPRPAEHGGPFDVVNDGVYSDPLLVS
jgi:hypothetical protein